MSAISNNEIKKIRSLGDKKFRDKLGLFVVEGEKMVEELLASSLEVEKVYRREEIGEEAMKKISFLSSASPVLAVAKKPATLSLTEDPFAQCGKGLFLALDAIRDPGNLGTILRVADWFGIDGIFASRDTVDIFNPKVVQSTMGSIFRVPFHYTDVPAICRHAVAHGGSVYGTFLDGEDIYRKQLDKGTDSPSVIIVGNESNGISTEVGALVTDRLLIPPFRPHRGHPESLNAAIATAITISEFRR